MEVKSSKIFDPVTAAPPIYCSYSGSAHFATSQGGFLGSTLSKVSKRLLDIALSVLMILAFGPIMIMLASYIAFVYRIPPLFKHTRVGKDGQLFKCYKFRTMKPNSDSLLEDFIQSDPALSQEWEETHKLRDDPRILPGIGKLLRKSSLDELPQAFNVLFGHMSIVGPRPVTVDELAHYGRYVSYYTAAKPGITGAWQIGGRSDTSFEDRVSMDVWYVENASLRLDIKIFWKTVCLFLSGRLLGGF